MNAGFLPSIKNQPGVFVSPAGVQPEQQMEIFRILAAILHLGNVSIHASGRGSDRSSVDVREVPRFLPDWAAASVNEG